MYMISILVGLQILQYSLIFLFHGVSISILFRRMLLVGYFSFSSVSISILFHQGLLAGKCVLNACFKVNTVYCLPVLNGGDFTVGSISILFRRLLVVGAVCFSVNTLL